MRHLTICLCWTAIAIEGARTVICFVLTFLFGNNQDPIEDRVADFVDLYVPSTHGLFVQAALVLGAGTIVWLFTRPRPSPEASR